MVIETFCFWNSKDFYDYIKKGLNITAIPDRVRNKSRIQVYVLLSPELK